MRFALDDDQQAYRDAVRALLDDHPGTARAGWAEGPADRRIWERLTEMGVLGVLIPDDAGGLGLDDVTLVAVLEETGRAGLPHPVVETAAVAAPIVGDRGMVTTDLGGPNVPWAAEADALLLLAEDGLHLVGRDATTITPVPGVDRARRLGRVAWRPAGSTLITDDPVVIDRARDRGALGAAAQLVGLAQRMLELAVAYAKERRQFGVPIGSFQAVKHHLADALKELAFARPAVYRAAWSLATGAENAARDVSMAKAMASDAASFVGRRALQCHGAIGYTVEHDLHLYLKRAWALSATWGDAAAHRDRVARALRV